MSKPIYEALDRKAADLAKARRGLDREAVSTTTGWVTLAEGFAIRLTPQAAAPAVKVLEEAFGTPFELKTIRDGLQAGVPRDGRPLEPAGRVWEAVHKLLGMPGVEHAEPLWVMRAPVPREAGDAPFRMGHVDPVSEALRAASRPCEWSLDVLGVRDAWKAWKERHPGEPLPGHGILVAHPDTGYSGHPELRDALQSPGFNFVEPRKPKDAADPLDKKGHEFWEFPGHGTATGSVIASREGAQLDPESGSWVSGVAPGACILPMRVSDSVVHLDYGNLIRALYQGTDAGAHVFSMSLGGPLASEELRRAIRYAHSRGVIVCVAAGNYGKFFGWLIGGQVTYPARYPEVVAVAASNALHEPWLHSCRGSAVDVTAPGQLVWHASVHEPNAYEVTHGSGTSFAVAGVAGLAALWLSYHGRDKLFDRYGSRLPEVFARLLRRSAATHDPDGKPYQFLRSGEFGTGVANAAGLLRETLPELRASETRVVAAGTRLAPLMETLKEEPLEAARPAARGLTARGLEAARSARQEEGERVSRSLLARLLGSRETPEVLLQEVEAILATDLRLQPHVSQAFQGVLEPLRRALLSQPISEPLRLRLEAAAASGPSEQVAEGVTSEPPEPTVRRLQVYAFDPSMETQMQNAVINRVTVAIPWERDLKEGPVGDYLEVVDIDPPSGCAYAPVDLNHPHLLAQDGLSPSEGNPQFHQQMVYAVAMNTIRHFERALGRPLFWAPRPRDRGRDAFVRRLRVYPHALREANAYYSPEKRALLFGYFPATRTSPGRIAAGGMVFTCLSHDIIAHETTHAILDGMLPRYNEPSNLDVWAFHEAFADIVALLQHFTYPEVLRHQIAQTRGDLALESQLGQLAQQFGEATGARQALRSVIGRKDEEGRWRRIQPDERAHERTDEAHDRGSILVTAIFDAFIAIYLSRTEDLLRIATGGTGVLPQGHIHPDLVRRLAAEAADVAGTLLTMCIRALDYAPPVDITFGDYLRALVTASYDLVPLEERRYRIALIEAFRKWAIYPRDVRTLSEESLRWRGPEGACLQQIAPEALEPMRAVIQEMGALRGQPGGRERLFRKMQDAQAVFQRYLKAEQARRGEKDPLIVGLDPEMLLAARATPTRGLTSVQGLRPAVRVGPGDELLHEIVVEGTQWRAFPLYDGPDSPMIRVRGGVTMVINLNTGALRYLVYKRLNEQRIRRQLEFERSRRAGSADPALWARDEQLPGGAYDFDVPDGEEERNEPFAVLHRTGKRLSLQRPA